MAKLELALLIGESSKEWLKSLELQLDRAEKIFAKDKPTKVKVKKEEPFTNEEEIEEAQSSQNFGEEEAEEVAESEEVEEQEENDNDNIDVTKLKTAKKPKTKKVTVDDVNDACKVRAVETSRQEVLGILRRKFKVGSVSDLKPEQYEDAIKAMALRS